MEQEKVIEQIKETAERILPEGASLWLYGSRARGDARPDSDYDILILLDQDPLTAEDEGKYSYPLYYWGTGIGAEINAHVYSKKEWFRWKNAPFHMNVDQDKRILI